MNQQTKDASGNKAVLATMTLADADAVFAAMAKATVEIAKIAARFDWLICRLKERAAALAEPHQKVCDAEYEKLAKYITLHPEQFKKPRTRKTAFGSYGLREGKPSVEIKDLAQVVEFADRHKLDLYKTEKIIDKIALMAELDKGKVPGARKIEAADAIVANVDKKLIDEAKRKAGGK